MKDTGFFKVTLPTGFSAGNKWYREASLRCLNGGDEEVIRESNELMLPARQVTRILALCVMRLGPYDNVGMKSIRSLTIGDQEALLLNLRRMTFGNKIQSFITCPNVNCNEKMDLEFFIDDILVPINPGAKCTYEEVISKNGASYTVRFRLPTGADQEAVADIAHYDMEKAVNLLMKRCIVEIKKNGRRIKSQDSVPTLIYESLSQRIEELDPQAEVVFNMTCPSCTHKFSANFDTANFFIRELMSSIQQYYQEVHILASHYHWSEKDILAMSNSKRKIYLKLITDSYDTEEI